MKTAKHTATYRFLTILFLLLCGIFFARPCKAEVTYENPDTSYVVSIEDEADLLSDEEESRLSTQMEEITAYGNVAFVSLDTNYTSTDSYAREHYRQLFGSDSGTLFVIDMDNRNIWIHSNGAIYRTITKSYADTITDSMRVAIDETMRRRKVQQAYNEEHGITPTTIKKSVRDLISISKKVAQEEMEFEKDPESMSQKELEKLIKDVTKKMQKAAAELNFEAAAELRDKMINLKKMYEETKKQ